MKLFYRLIFRAGLKRLNASIYHSPRPLGRDSFFVSSLTWLRLAIGAMAADVINFFKYLRLGVCSAIPASTFSRVSK